MAIDFPGSPSTGQRHSHNNTTWEWDGSSWNRITIDLSTTDAATLSGIAATQFARRDDDNIITGVTTFIGNGYTGVGNTVLIVEGDARVTGVLSVGQGSVSINERDIYAVGVVTGSNFKTGTTNVHNVGIEAAGINVLGADTPIGAGATVYNSGLIVSKSGAEYQGVVTASSFVGDITGNVTGNVSGSSGSSTGNAATAGKLQTARTIGGVSFDGGANINLPGVNIAGNQNTTGTAALAEGLTGTPDITVRNVTVTGIQTAEDVKNIDSIGIITARTGIDVTGGTFKADGLVGAAGSVLSSTGSGINWVSPQTGPQGAAGAQGAVGAQGAAGVAGAQGAQGHQGRQGAAGAAGAQGVTGAQGHQGVQGTTGNTGAQGVQGAQGRQGAQGAQGVQGAAGAQGNQGVQGAAGAAGAQGAQGAQGHQGVQGSVGIASLTISTSAPSSPAQGDMWWDSDDATLGLYYNDGNSSQWVNINHGPAGAQGAQGVQGAQGHQGVQGAQGHQGVQGAAGAQGATGAQGHQGVQGAGGSTGAAGAQGAQGATGSATISNNADNRVITGGSGTNLNGEASLTFDGTQLEVNGSSTNYPIKVSGSANAKVLLTGASSPYIQWQEGTTNRAYAWWDSNNNRFELKNEQENTYLRLDSQINFSIGNSEKVRIDSSGRLLVGHTAAYGSGKAQVFNTAQYVLDLSTWSADANGPTIDFYKSRNATIGSSTVVQSGDVIGKLRFLGNDGANSRTAAQITAEVDGTPGTNDMPGRLVFSTVPDNSTSVTERLRITSAGVVSINDSTPETWAALQVKNGSGSNAAQFLLHGADMAQIMLKDDTGGSNTKITTIRNDQGTLLIGTHNDAYGGFAHKYRITTAGTHVFGGNTAAPIVDNGELLYRGNSTQTFESLPQSFYVYGDSLGSGSANAGTGLVLGGKYRTDGQITTFAGIHGIKENTTNDEYGGALVFGVRQNGSSSWERLRIKSDGQIKKKQGANVTSLKTYNSNADAFWLDHYQYQSSGTYQRYTDIVSIGDGTWGSNIRFFTNANGSANGIERLRITSAGAMNVANQPSFSITTTNTNTFGTSGSHYALSYASPIPIFTSGETTTEHHVGSVLTYTDYVAGSNTGRYVKFTAPVAGNYLFGINAECSVAADDWVGFGFEINNTGTHNTTLERLVAWTHNQSAEDATAQARRRSFQASCLIRLAKDDTIVPYQQSSGTSSMSNTFRVWGMLVN